jgi:hypothetical protein
MSALKGQIAATITGGKPWARSVTTTGGGGLSVRCAKYAGFRKAAQRTADPEVEP